MKILKIFSLWVFLLLLSSCFLRKNDFSLAKRFLSKGLCEKSQQSFHKIKNKTKKQKQFAYIAAEKCLKKYKNPKTSFLFYETLLSENLKQDSFLSFKEKKQIEFKLAQLSFHDLKNYRKAIKFYKESLKYVPHPQQKFFHQYQIADSFFLLGKYDQSLEEIEKALLEVGKPQDKQKAMILKGRNLISKKIFNKAIRFFERLIVEYPKKESFFREYLALIYEEKKDFSAAIREIEKIEPPTQFTRQKIQSLYERLKNQPGINNL